MTYSAYISLYEESAYKPCTQVITWNVDGLRGKLRVQGLAKIVNEELPDLLVIQEVKMQVIAGASLFALHVYMTHNPLASTRSTPSPSCDWQK